MHGTVSTTGGAGTQFWAPLCQQVVHRAEDPDFDLRRLVPAPTNTPDDAGPWVCGCASHPDPAFPT
ncbi:MAG: hypothetical protein ACLSB9_20745 [Hydrogeniiclostridium mannosilyticum]